MHGIVSSCVVGVALSCVLCKYCYAVLCNVLLDKQYMFTLLPSLTHIYALIDDLFIDKLYLRL